MEEKFCLTRFLVFALCIQLKSYGAAVKGADTLSLGASITGNQTIISKNATFELGFFNPNGTNNWYIGIWYANLIEKTYMWVANRETPARNRSGVLKLSKRGDLGLFDAMGVSLWSVNVTQKSSQAVLLDSGNFVMLSDDNKSEIVWQSFDYPVDTLLPGMRFGGPQKLVSWKSSSDPAPGLFSFQLDPSGAKQFILKWNNSVQYWTTGTWDRNFFSQIPEMASKALYNFSAEDTKSGLYIKFTLSNMVNALSRYVLTKSGGQQLYILLDNGRWSMFWSQPTDQCSVYGLCGAYGTCNSNINLDFCSCVEGFTPADTRAWESRESWSSGCVRQSPLNCNPQNGSADGFVELSVTLSDADSAWSNSTTTKQDCQKACLLNCSCTAFAFNPPSGPCQLWSGDLLNMRSSLPSKSNSNFCIRVAASALQKFDPTHSSKRRITSIMGAVLGIVGAVAGIFSFLIWRRHRRRSMVRHPDPDPSDSFLRMFSYMELKIATRNFRSKLGRGGFGTVFKGHLLDGTPVAVKKMEGSRQDDKQFRAEISSLGNIQHVNLIRLRGFCAQGSRRFLIYDYMPNGSLNSLLFNSNLKCKNRVLDWKTRFQIALGTARALLYLHEECRDRIIHADVKPENILLDNNLSPKLADFGLAKLVGRDFSRVLTTTRGTRGYLAPEWISGLPITAKVDVYSFGMTLFEILSGRRNLDLTVQDSNQYYFPTWAATQICNGNTTNIVEEGIAEERDIEEVRRASIVALLCIERDEEVRPSMGQVVQMLEGKMQLQIQQIRSSLVVDKNAEQSSDTDTS